MSQITYLLLAIATLTLLTVATRTLPFIFSRHLSQSTRAQVLGKYLPAAIMTLLVVYELHPGNAQVDGHLFAQVIALLCVAVIHVWRRNIILSLAVGMLVYLPLLSLMRHFF